MGLLSGRPRQVKGRDGLKKALRRNAPAIWAKGEDHCGQLYYYYRREYGSGGRVIGQQVAEELGIAFYDKKLITLAAKESGFAEDIIERVEQKKELSFFYNLYLTGQEMSLSEQVFLAECNVIRKIAEEHSCVILGRCADYVLQEQKNCLRVFIHAPLALRAKWVREQYKVNRPDLEDYIRKQDKNRAAYYNYFTHNKWGNPAITTSVSTAASGLPLVSAF